MGRGDHDRMAADRRAAASPLTSRKRPCQQGKKPRGPWNPRPPGPTARSLSYARTKIRARKAARAPSSGSINPGERSGLAGDVSPRATDSVASAAYAPLARRARAAAASSSWNSSSVRENSTRRGRLSGWRDLRPAGAPPACRRLSLAPAIPRILLLLPSCFRIVNCLLSKLSTSVYGIGDTRHGKSTDRARSRDNPGLCTSCSQSADLLFLLTCWNELPFPRRLCGS